MIAKSLAFCLALCVGYLFLVPYLPAPSKGLQGGTQWEKNKFKEESLLCNQKDYDVVVVGSSISGTFVHLPSNWFNLAMASYSSINGLEIICNSDLKPCTIVVETNNLNLGLTPYFQTSRIGRAIKRQLPAFQTVNKPTHTALRTIGRIAGLKSGASQPPSFDPSLPDKRTVSAEIFEKALRRRLETASKELDPTKLMSRLDRLKRSVEILDSRGFTVIFMEVPECEQTYNSALKKQFRQSLKACFSEPKYHWIDDHENGHIYASNDAIHLVASSSYRFSQKLVKEVSEAQDGLVATDAQGVKR